MFTLRCCIGGTLSPSKSRRVVLPLLPITKALSHPRYIRVKARNRPVQANSAYEEEIGDQEDEGHSHTRSTTRTPEWIRRKPTFQSDGLGLPAGFLDGKASKRAEARETFSSIVRVLERNGGNHLELEDLLFVLSIHPRGREGTLSVDALRNLYLALITRPVDRFIMSEEDFNHFFEHLLHPFVEGGVSPSDPVMPDDVRKLARNWMEDMKVFGLRVDGSTLSWFLLAVEGEGVESVGKLWGQAKKAGLVPTVEGFNVLIRSHLGRERDASTIEDPWDLWNLLRSTNIRPNVRTSEAMLRVFTDTYDHVSIINFLRSLMASDMPWRQRTYVAVMNALAEIGDTEDVLTYDMLVDRMREENVERGREFEVGYMKWLLKKGDPVAVLKRWVVYEKYGEEDGGAITHEEVEMFLWACRFNVSEEHVGEGLGIGSVEGLGDGVGRVVLWERVLPVVRDMVLGVKPCGVGVGWGTWDKVVQTVLAVRRSTKEDLWRVWEEGKEIARKVDGAEGSSKYVPSQTTLYTIMTRFGEWRDEEVLEKFLVNEIFIPELLEVYPGEDGFEDFYEILLREWVLGEPEGADRQTRRLDEMQAALARARMVEMRRRDEQEVKADLVK
ncbi:hypothetical protein HDV00_006473 [Rhizophlyctis rosea]|nr:hypothetical protein HDV00_006473 [Rhizophlyctis rosea]